MKQITYYLIVAMFFGCDRPHATDKDTRTRTKVFDLLSPMETGVDFINSIRENVETNENVFDFDYFYNGSGVATVDLDNDGLLDLVFAGNQVGNRIYRNKGNLQFEDVTKKSGINDRKGWSTGVTFADINKDGWQDIYISQGGPHPGDSSRNLLFINNQDFTFKELADFYGLADESISSQAAFFDYDKDGDLDCIVMNENLLYGVGPTTFFKLVENNPKLRHHSSSHLYRNDNDHFVDVTEEAGILAATFGLGLAVSDINNDGWLDIYITNDYYVPDAMYLNQGNGTFKNKIKDHTNQISFFGMGVDVADINNDTYQDIFVLDMASTDHYRSKTLMASMNVEAFNLLVSDLALHHQYMFNSLQLNQGNGNFRNIAQLTNMSKSDWSWAVLMEDFDNNTTTDVFITNGYKKYALNNDIRMKVLQAKKEYDGNVPVPVKQEIYELMPSEKLPNLLFQNNGNLQFKNVAADWGLSKPSFSNGAVHADLDNDGDLDLVVNNIDDPAFIYKNTTVDKKLGSFLKVKTQGELDHSFPKVTVYSEGQVQAKESKSVRGYLSSTDPIIHFGMGQRNTIDSVSVNWLSGKYEVKYNLRTNTTIEFIEDQAKPITVSAVRNSTSTKLLSAKELGVDFVHKENEFDDFELETLLPYKQSTIGPCIAVGDVNADNLEDVFIGGAANQYGKLYIQTTDHQFLDVTPQVFVRDAHSEDIDAIFFDVDVDGDQDLYVVSGGYEYEDLSNEYIDRLYINNGFGSFQKAKNTLLDEHRFSGKSVDIIDYNNDGLQDILVGNRITPGKYPKAPTSILYKNTGNQLVDVTGQVLPHLSDFGMVNDVLRTDIDQDGWQDIIIVGEWTRLGIFHNNKGVFEEVSVLNDWKELRGWWYSIQELDINADNLPDYVVGNLGLNSKYKTSIDKPLKIYASDFDNNSAWDIVFSNSYQGNYVPYRGRECSSGQMPFIAEDFPTYDLFAKATIEDIYGDKLNDAYFKYVNEFSSVALLNKGDGKFDLTYLPKEAQVSPILDMEVLDFNYDGFQDLFILGTIYNTEVETPRLDGGSGMILLNNSKGQLLFSDYFNRELYIEGNLKTVKRISLGKENHLMVGRNNDSPVFLKIDKKD